MSKLKSLISSLETKEVALRKVTDEIQGQLAEVKRLTANPTPVAQVRQQTKQQRVAGFAKNYMEGKWMHKNKKSASA